MTATFYKTRLVAGGPWVGVRVACEPPTDPLTGEVLDRSPMWSVEIDGELARAPSPDRDGAGVFLVEAMKPISKDEFNYLRRVKDHATKVDPRYPEARPKKAIDIGKLPPIF